MELDIDGGELMSLGLLVLRVVIGALFIGHGAQKLFGVFGGHGLRGTAGFFESIGLKPGQVHAQAAGLLELCGGVLFVLGLLTPAASVALIAVMTAAVLAVHGPKGIWASDGGFEYNLTLAAAAFALAAIGPGAWSIDSAVGLSIHGVGWAVGALAVGLLGGIGAVLTGRAQARQERRRPRRATGRPTAA
jgi:putative oxidoreductase